MHSQSLANGLSKDWMDVPIKLETAAPTFGVELPSLSRWTVGVYRPVALYKTGSGVRPLLSNSSMMHKESKKKRRDSDESSLGTAAPDEAKVTSKGNITATFTIPGLMSIPSDGVAHNVTITQLSLGAEMEWVSIPKLEAKFHLKVRVTSPCPRC